MTVQVEIPIRTTTGLNAREHWRVRARRVQAERRATALVWRSCVGALPPARGPILVTLTRIGPRKCDDDNLQGGLKAVRDQIAAELGVDDGDTTLVAWRYRQERGPFGVRVRVYEKSRLEERIVPAGEEA